MNSAADSPTPAQDSSRPTLTLTIRGLGHVPSFKTGKTAITVVNRMGSHYARPLTRKEHRETMRRITELFASQLLSACRTAIGETATEQQVRCWIASFVPADDCLAWIPEGGWRGVTLVAPGHEGADITVERIS